MSDDITNKLWAPRSVEETQEIYAKWGKTYDADMVDWGYVTPDRIAKALAGLVSDRAGPVLDFGCGTGLCGAALSAQGFEAVDGTDISPEMLAKAEARDVYRRVWHGEPGSLGDVLRGDYPVIVASGVISLGAAPPETLDLLVSALAPGALLGFSFNEATMQDETYTGKLAAVAEAPGIEIAFQETGPHLPAKNMTSTVFVLRRL